MIRTDSRGQPLNRGDSIRVGDKYTGYNSTVKYGEAGNFIVTSNGSAVNGGNVTKN